MAIPAVLDAGEIRCRSVCLASGLFPLSLCLSLLCEWLFKAGQAFLHNLPQSRGYSFPRGEVDIYGLQVPYAYIFVSQLGSAACRGFASCQLTVEVLAGILPSSMRTTCPIQRMLLGIPALSRTLLLVTLCCQMMCSMRRRQRIWNALSFFSSRARRVQDSLPYRRVLRAQAL